MKKQYILTERAHFMCPNMHFAIEADIKAEANLSKINECLETMAKAHPFLRSTIAFEAEKRRAYYNISYQSKIRVIVRKDAGTLWQDYEDIGMKEWNVLQNGLLKVLIYPGTDSLKLLFVAHHLLGDGRCLLELIREFADLYTVGKIPLYAPERLIQGQDDLPAGSKLTGINKLLIKYLNAKWRKEDRCINYDFYASFADEFVKENPVSHETLVIDEPELCMIKSYCRENDITINDLLMAQTYTAMDTKKIIIAADIRERLPFYQKGACGNYASAMGIVCKDKGQDLAQRARTVKSRVKAFMKNDKKLMTVLSCYISMEPGLIDATVAATLGEFESKAAKTVGEKILGYEKRDGISITNLGRITHPNITCATFIPPASPATVQTLGVLTVNDRMRICSSFYEKSVSREQVRKQLEVIGRYKGIFITRGQIVHNI